MWRTVQRELELLLAELRPAVRRIAWWPMRRSDMPHLTLMLGSGAEASAELPVPSPNAGVHYLVAPPGQIAIQAVGANGVEVAQLRMAEALFDEEYVQMFWTLLANCAPLAAPARHAVMLR
jgi:hypothetical protein